MEFLTCYLDVFYCFSGGTISLYRKLAYWYVLCARNYAVQLVGERYIKKELGLILVFKLITVCKDESKTYRKNLSSIITLKVDVHYMDQ